MRSLIFRPSDVHIIEKDKPGLIKTHFSEIYFLESVDMSFINYRWFQIRLKLARILLRLIWSFCNPYSPWFFHSINFYIWKQAKQAAFGEDEIDMVNPVDQV